MKINSRLVLMKELGWPTPRIFVSIGKKKTQFKVEIESDALIEAFIKELGQPIRYQTKGQLKKGLSVAFNKILEAMREAPMRAVEDVNV
jgi:hypothetical protein